MCPKAVTTTMFFFHFIKNYKQEKEANTLDI